MVRKAALVCAITSLLLGRPAMAGEYGDALSNGNKFYESCRLFRDPNIDSVSFGLCVGFVRGIVGRDGLFPPSRHICMPETVTIGQAVDVILRVMEAHPELRDKSLNALATASLETTWPCTKP